MTAYSGSEWALLTGLPIRVVAAAASAGPGEPDRVVAQGLAGSAAIAAGRVSDSELVRAVVAAIYREPERRPEVDCHPEGGRHPGAGRRPKAGRRAEAGRRARPADAGRGPGPPTGSGGMTPGLRAACHSAATLLAERADPADSAAYRQWVQSTAARVRRAADRPAITGTTPARDRDERFLAELGTALLLC